MAKGSDPSVGQKHRPAHVKKQQAAQLKKKKAKVPCPHPLPLEDPRCLPIDPPAWGQWFQSIVLLLDFDGPP